MILADRPNLEPHSVRILQSHPVSRYPLRHRPFAALNPDPGPHQCRESQEFVGLWLLDVVEEGQPLPLLVASSIRRIGLQWEVGIGVAVAPDLGPAVQDRGIGRLENRGSGRCGARYRSDEDVPAGSRGTSRLIRRMRCSGKASSRRPQGAE